MRVVVKRKQQHSNLQPPIINAKTASMIIALKRFTLQQDQNEINNEIPFGERNDAAPVGQPQGGNAATLTVNVLLLFAGLILAML